MTSHTAIPTMHRHPQVVPAPEMNATRTIRLGCSLAYLAEERSHILLLIQPAPSPGQRILSEEITVGSGEALERLTDAHGNKVLRATLVPGKNTFRHEAVLRVPVNNEHVLPRLDNSSDKLPFDVIRYTLPSRYCESDKLVPFASKQFGCGKGMETVQKICDWTHRHLEYRYGSGDPTLSACEALQRGYGVCRDFAHVMVALCRALDIPARYVAGHMPLIGASIPDSDIGIDFHAYVEVYVEGAWRVFDPRYNRPYPGRIKIAHGADAVDAAFATYIGPVKPVTFEVWSYAIDDGASLKGN
ncbi:transglutaminase family protein [Noviherbaspirillum sp.]|uniref:transglutaminase-like domain-containing protein n=1 Tax=Noviherbaspirillum sp. TaxID=1926288 RepID=UPI002D5358E9|nr:transglutaminase family protein [Noviherbaspirillum sp.]HZW19731.1 transglutaminase family protein [Noviherbaspirillum sp.]